MRIRAWFIVVAVTLLAASVAVPVGASQEGDKWAAYDPTDLSGIQSIGTGNGITSYTLREKPYVVGEKGDGAAMPDGSQYYAAPNSYGTVVMTVPPSHFWNLGHGLAYATFQPAVMRTKLEAQSECYPGNSTFTADAWALWRVTPGHEDVYSLTVDSAIWGMIRTIGTGGSGIAHGQVYVSVLDETAGGIEIASKYLFDKSNPQLTKWPPQIEKTDKYVGVPLNNQVTFQMTPGRVYQVNVTLKTDCTTYALYTLRSDFSRNSPDPIGSYNINGIKFGW